jgi:hypothetical protein
MYPATALRKRIYADSILSCVNPSKKSFHFLNSQYSDLYTNVAVTE